MDGRGGDKSYGANKDYLDVKDKFFEKYRKAGSRKEKQTYRDEVITEVKNAGYRFLIRLVNREGVYRERTKEEVEKKVSQALRERRKATTEPCNANQAKRQCISTTGPCNARQPKRQCISYPGNGDRPGAAHALDNPANHGNNNQRSDGKICIEHCDNHYPRVTQVLVEDAASKTNNVPCASVNENEILTQAESLNHEDDFSLGDLSSVPWSEEWDNNSDGDVLSDKGGEDARIDWVEFTDAANRESKYQGSDGKTDIEHGNNHYQGGKQFVQDDGLVGDGESKTNTSTYSSVRKDDIPIFNPEIQNNQDGAVEMVTEKGGLSDRPASLNTYVLDVYSFWSGSPLK